MMTISHFASLRLGRHTPGSAMTIHHHETPSLCLLLRGEYEERIRGRKSLHIAGSLLYCPADEPHSQRIGRSGAFKLILTPTDVGLDFLSSHAPLEEAPTTRSANTVAIGRRMITELTIKDGFSMLALEGLGYELLAAFGRSIAHQWDVPAARLRDARDYMAVHIDEPLNVPQIAAAIGCSPVSLSRSFRRAFGLTIGNYQRELRVEAAAKLLSEGRMPLAEIAQACGFHDQPHMTRTFKAATGCTPGAFRRSA